MFNRRRKNQQGYYEGQDSLGRKSWRKVVEAASDDIRGELEMSWDDYALTVNAAREALDGGDDTTYHILIEHGARIQEVVQMLGTHYEDLSDENVDIDEWIDNYSRFKEEYNLYHEPSHGFINVTGRYSTIPHVSGEFIKQTSEYVEQMTYSPEEFLEAERHYQDNYNERVGSDGEDNPYHGQFDERGDYRDESVEPGTVQGKDGRGVFRKIVDGFNKTSEEYEQQSLLRAALPDMLSGIRFKPIRIGRFWIRLGKDSFINSFPYIVPSSISMDTIGGMNSIIYSQKYKPQLVSSYNSGMGVWFQSPRQKKDGQPARRVDPDYADHEEHDNGGVPDPDDYQRPRREQKKSQRHTSPRSGNTPSDPPPKTQRDIRREEDQKLSQRRIQLVKEASTQWLREDDEIRQNRQEDIDQDYIDNGGENVDEIIASYEADRQRRVAERAEEVKKINEKFDQEKREVDKRRKQEDKEYRQRVRQARRSDRQAYRRLKKLNNHAYRRRREKIINEREKRRRSQ